MRILDIFEVARLEVWPLWSLEDTPKKRDDAIAYNKARKKLDAYEYSAYINAIEKSKYGAILNEKIPPISKRLPLPESYSFRLISEETKNLRDHPDVKIARRAENLARLAAVAHERGEVSAGLRRVLVVQAVRLVHKTAERFNYATRGDDTTDTKLLRVEDLIGSVHIPTDDEGSDD